jgi:hypothetical protein
MEKKLIVVLFMITLLTGGVFAQEKLLSVGVGVLAVPSFSEYKYEAPGFSDTMKMNRFGMGVNVFFDITYVEINMGLLFGEYKSDMSGDRYFTEIVFGLVGKYPIHIGKKIVFFPFVGIDYNYNLLSEMGGFEAQDDSYDNLSILLGIGFDFGLTDTMYIRTEAGYGFMLNNQVQNDMIDSATAVGGKCSITQGKIPIKVALGFRF